MRAASGLHFWTFVNGPDRLGRPLIRTGSRLLEASWDDAMELIAGRSRELIRDHTASSIGFYITGQLFTEEYHLLGLLGKAGLGTPHMDGHARLCTATAGISLRESLGTPGNPSSDRDFDTTECLLHFGRNMA